MLEPIRPDTTPRQLPPALREPRPPVDFAKWPPDDDDDDAAGGQLPPAGGGGGGGSFDVGDGNFRKGRFSIAAIVVLVVAAAGLIAFLLIGFKQEGERLTVEQAEERKKAIFVLPKEEQLQKWIEWGNKDSSDHLKVEAMRQLAWAKKPEGVDIAVKALDHPDEGVQAMAATALAEYGSPMADKAKPKLLEKLKKAGPGSRPQIAWALVELGEPAAFDEVLALYKLGHLSKVQRLGGGLAFDPDKIVKLVSLDKIASLAGDDSPAVRQLVATVLSREANAKYTDTLIKLLQDPDGAVARQAAPGLGRIGDEKAKKPLIEAIRKGDKESRTKYLEALRDGMGGPGLVLAFDTVNKEDDKKQWYETKRIMDMIRQIVDPRSGDGLLKFIESEPHIHWETEAAIAMAEAGDVRAVPYLARRLRMNPTKVYSDKYDWEMALKRDDKERVVSARMIADLAKLHPDKVEQIRKQSEDAVWFWITDLPSPHANGLRALAAMGSDKDMKQLRDWAFPGKELPPEGAQPPMPEEWVIAQSAMRYIGWLKDEQSWGNFEKALKKRPADIDATMKSLMGGGLAILGMTLKAIGHGAAYGLAEWGDPKGFDMMMEYIEDKKNNEQSRTKMCFGLAWVAEKEDMLAVAKKIGEYDKPDPESKFIRECLLETLVTRPIPGTSAALVEMMKPEAGMKVNQQLARAIGKAGFEKGVEDKLFEHMKNEKLMTSAALALILGGSPDTAARAVAMFVDKDKAVAEELQDLWFRTFGYWSTDDLESGRIFRWVDNAEAIARVMLKQTAQEWARVLLTKQFDNLQFDNGPHSFTRVELRVRLKRMVEGNDKAKREGAARTLRFMKETGTLMALAAKEGETGKTAGRALFELRNPKVVTGVKIPEVEKKE